MPALFVFLLKVNIALIVFCLGYYLVLRKLTFYTLNRVYLGIAIIFSSVYPFINLDDFLQRHQQIAIPVQNVIIDWKVPAERFIQQPGYWFWATLIFWLGVIVFAGKLLVQLLSLYKLYKNSERANIQEHNVRVVKVDISPFSFWQSIYINPDNLNPGDLKSILQHEQIHVSEWHTMDILLAEISVIFYWFNPGVWLMKKAVRENIEFITDRKVLQKGMDSKAYQYSLLSVSFNTTTSAGIANHFNFSTLKKRIKMMNAKRSSNVNLTRYAFLVPVVLICLLTISLSKAELVKQTKTAYKSIAASVNKMITITPVNTDTVPVKKRLGDTAKKINIVTVTSSNDQNIVIDTGRKITLTVSNNNNNTDSITYYINEIRVTKSDLNNLSPNNISAVNIMNDDKFSQFGKSVHFYTKYDPNLKAVTGIKVTDAARFNPNKPIDTNGTRMFYKIETKPMKINSSTTFIESGVAARVVSASTVNWYKTTRDTSGISSAYKVKGIPLGPNVRADNRGAAPVTVADGREIKDITVTGFASSKNPNSRFVIRGTKHMPGLDETLVILDGKETEQRMDDLGLDPNDIESIDILNGKSATDKYGDKAKNGVIIINLKKKKQ